MLFGEALYALNGRGRCRDHHRDWIASAQGRTVIQYFVVVVPARVAACSSERERNAGRCKPAHCSLARAPCNAGHCNSAPQRAVGCRPVGAVRCSWARSAAIRSGYPRARPVEFHVFQRARAWARADCMTDLARWPPLEPAALTESGCHVPELIGCHCADRPPQASLLGRAEWRWTMHCDFPNRSQSRAERRDTDHCRVCDPGSNCWGAAWYDFPGAWDWLEVQLPSCSWPGWHFDSGSASQ